MPNDLTARFFLNDPEDMQWLRDTHLKGLTVPAFASALLAGNEDSPAFIYLYAAQEPLVGDPAIAEIVQDDDGSYHRQA